MRTTCFLASVLCAVGAAAPAFAQSAVEAANGGPPAGVQPLILEGWLLSNDNPDKAGWPTQPWPKNAAVVGQVKWLGRALT